MPQGLIFDFHRGTTHDGPGMRTTVFFKGCPLHCKWCHNPESISPNPEIQWTKGKCIGCFNCIKGCGKHAILDTGAGIYIDKDICIGCYRCAENCPANALEKVGKLWSVEELVKEACKDDMFFEEFTGGITVSGGEPMVQYRFITEFLKAIKEKGEHTALDTSGFGKQEAYDSVYPYVDTFLYDIKLMDDDEHIHYTGVSNELILSNLKSIADKIRIRQDTELWIRTPLIPGVTAMSKNLNEIGRFLQQELSGEISRWELCAFNNVCRDKYVKLNQKWDYGETPLMSEAEVEEMAAVARRYVGDKLVVSGLTGK